MSLELLRRGASHRLPYWLRSAGLCAVLSVSSSALAQSAADKATARQLATQGIQAYRSGGYDDALDKLKRAQALYDAPIHLLYMARAQVKLGKLVEGAESYRRLLRFEATAGTPKVFLDALDDAETELPELEPRIPTLTIDVTPAGAPGLEITMDGEPVSAAVLGISRPANPGDHQLEAKAQGYHTAQASVGLAEGQSRNVSLAMQVDPDAKPPEAAAAAAGVEPGVAPAEVGPQPDFPGDGLGFFVGLRGGVLLSGGDLEENRPVGDFLGVGGGAELHGGARFAKFVAVKLFGEVYGFQPVGRLTNTPEDVRTVAAVTAETKTPTLVGFGISGMFHLPRQPEKPGLFAELGVGLQRLGWDTVVASVALEEDCTIHAGYSGTFGRLMAGFTYPMHKHFDFNFVVGINAGTFNTKEASSTCVGVPGAGLVNEADKTMTDPVIRDPFNESNSIEGPKPHVGAFIGAGFDFVFGNY